MGGGDLVEHQNLVSLMPDIALCAIDRIEKIKFKIKDTPGGGNLLGILQPVWYKAVESDMRLEWIEEMLRRGIVVREIQSFGENISNQLRAESSKEEELGREALISLMKVKHKDERRHHHECIRVKEQIKDWLKREFG